MSSKNKMFLSGLHSTSDDQSTETQKNAKRLPMSTKNKMFIFGLCSNSDDWLSNLSDKRQLKCKKKKKKGPLCHQNIKC